MAVTGILRKMMVDYADPVNYQLRIGDDNIPLNELIGHQLTLTFTGNIYCVQCGRKTNKSFQQGHCFPCLRRLQECNLCIIHPERCLVEQQGCQQDDWAHAHCHQSHIIYLANSTGLKVGITRATQVPTRWIDQGACQAIKICQVGNRYRSGRLEVALKNFVNDKTNWRALLKADAEKIDLVSARDQLLATAQTEITALQKEFGEQAWVWLDKEKPCEIHYPVSRYPAKISSLSLDKTPEVAGLLEGIKGQYLLLDSGVINIRKFSGYEVRYH